MTLLGNQLEEGLTQEHMATNAETWRHIWFVQRFIQHGIKAIMRGSKAGDDLFAITNQIIENPQAYHTVSIGGDLGCVIRNTMTVTKAMSRGEIAQFITEALLDRCLTHDQSKLVDPEVHTFVEVTPKLKKTEFNSPEYNKLRDEMKPALDNHYAQNRHHPEHYEDGVRSMTIVDVIEMLCDWLASSLRQPNGCIENSINFCQERFGFDDHFAETLRLTVAYHYELEQMRDPSHFYTQTI